MPKSSPSAIRQSRRHGSRYSTVAADRHHKYSRTFVVADVAGSHRHAEAEFQIRAVDDWWRANRPAAPDLFREELSDAFLTIRTLPLMRRPVRHRMVKGVRRVILRATRYRAYYVVHGEAVFILAVWKAVRGSGPPLSAP